MTPTLEMLQDATAAYHRLITGGQVAEFRDQNGELIRYTSANRAALLNYIKWLESKLNITPVTSNGPMRVFF